ncbi:hypothetical protein G9272_32285 [Streptomyces asoensis]|uniref:RuvC-like resolvase n=1 Tax=Streptomyces asoensis TaxID=249586 RepID=A0A6M4WVZ2_9ACTN|nr:hypothetical protein [Streptomyces asoensis]QJT04398.1 hypothetical protein G9272_32285 [Streptomyces asoensis]
MTTLFDTTEIPAAPAAAGPRPLLIALDAATIVTGTAGVGWTDHVHAPAKNLHERFAQQLEGCATFYRHADYVVIEGAAFSKNNTGADALAAMRWMIRQDLWKRGIPYAVINPQSRNVYATGKTRPVPTTVPQKDRYKVGKGMIRDVVHERYGLLTEGKHRYDESDAYMLLALGLHSLGHVLAEVPQEWAEQALRGVEWHNLSAVTR